VDGYHLITFFDSEKPVYVTSSNPVGYARDYEDECGGNIKSYGEIIEYEWRDVSNDGQNELIFNVAEKNCKHAEMPSIKSRLVFSISKGRVSMLH
jgi:hypothetical protein